MKAEDSMHQDQLDQFKQTLRQEIEIKMEILTKQMESDRKEVSK